MIQITDFEFYRIELWINKQRKKNPDIFWPLQKLEKINQWLKVLHLESERMK